MEDSKNQYTDAPMDGKTIIVDCKDNRLVLTGAHLEGSELFRNALRDDHTYLTSCIEAPVMYQVVDYLLVQHAYSAPKSSRWSTKFVSEFSREFASKMREAAVLLGVPSLVELLDADGIKK